MTQRKGYIEKGLIAENPLFVLGLGICPALSCSSSASHALAMGLCTMAVMTASSCVVSAFKRIIPPRVRIPCYMLIIATFVTFSEYILRAFFTPIYNAIGIYLSLVTVNCLVLGRADGFARKHSIADSVFDGFAMGMGYTAALVTLGIIRELLGKGTVFGVRVLGTSFPVFPLLALAPGAFFVLGCMGAGAKKILKNRRRPGPTCEGCHVEGCMARED